jgi:exodeoxyribonuclease VII small subunit
MTTVNKKLYFASAINRLEEINRWFQQEDLDLDEGLAKLREGKELIKLCRQKLQTVDNELIKIDQEYSEEEVDSQSDGHTHKVLKVQGRGTDDILEEDSPF